MSARIVSFALLAVALAAGSAAAESAVRVRIAAGVGAVRIEGASLRVGGRPVHRTSLVATAVAGEIRVAGISERRPVSVDGVGPLAVDGRSYPGAVLLIPVDRGGMDVVNRVPLEQYVERSVSREVYASWPAEALRAQAVVARTYALHQARVHVSEEFDLKASVLSQRYGGGPVPAAIRRAVAATRGEYLTYEGAPILAAYHSSAGGRTASSAEVWGTALPYLSAVDSPDDEAPDYFWSFEIALADLRDALREAGYEGVEGAPVEVVETSRTRRVRILRVGDARLSGRELRQVLGGRAIRSARFDVRIDGDRVRFLGSGAGHGVGMDQWGARELARRGRTYRDIVLHYYPGSELVTLDRDADVAARSAGEAE